MVEQADYKQKYEESQLTIATLKQELEALKKMIFGSRHERFHPDHTNPSQLPLDMACDSALIAPVAGSQKITYTRTTTTEQKAHPVRMKLPEHLERREVVIEPTEDVSGLRRLGEEITEELDYEPGKLFVRRIIRPRYVSTDNQNFVIAPLVERPLPKAIAAAGLLTQIIIDKYLDHLPLNRQVERLKREGITLPYSTISDWVSATAKLLDPLYEALKKELIGSDYLHVDETPVKVLDKDKKGTTHRGYLWVYHNSLQDLVFFNYQMGRGREGPSAMLQGFKGHLQTDGYSAYNIFSDKEGITLFHCMAHARRKFYEARDNDPGRASYVLSQIQLLYDIERRARGELLSEQEIYQLRQSEALPILTS